MTECSSLYMFVYDRMFMFVYDRMFMFIYDRNNKNNTTCSSRVSAHYICFMEEHHFHALLVTVR